MTSATSDPPQGRRSDATRSTSGAAGQASNAALVHSLEVHQLELEVQNESLRSANEDLRASNLALVISRDRFRALYDFAPIPYVTIDSACEILDANHAAELVLATTRDHLIGSRFDLFVDVANRAAFTSFVATVFAAGVARSADVALVPLGVPGVDAMIQGVVIRDDPDSPLRCVLGIADITVRKRAEVERRRAQEEVLAIVSHDLRGPLNSISLACDGLAAGLSPDEHAECVRAIERAALRCERLIKDLLSVAHNESGRPEPDVRTFDASELVRRVCLEIELEAAPARCPIAVSVPAAPLMMRGDRDRLHQVLSNLIGNALVHARGSAIEVGVSAQGGVLVFAVSDAGPGIPIDEQPRIFERYRQGKSHHGGAGLGLAIVKGLVEAHRGTVVVQSEPGGGARFEITLPREPA